jgi:hypothetical protein
MQPLLKTVIEMRECGVFDERKLAHESLYFRGVSCETTANGISRGKLFLVAAFHIVQSTSTRHAASRFSQAHATSINDRQTPHKICPDHAWGTGAAK